MKLSMKHHNINMLNTITDKVGHNNWFIAGSFANSYIKNPGDIDIFFYSEENYQTAFNKTSGKGASSFNHLTENAYSYYDTKLQKPLQFVCKHFGTPEQIFNTFDINASMKAILPDGTRIEHPVSNDSLHILRINSSTFARYFKYINKLGLTDDIKNLGYKLIDDFIEDGTICTEYYEGQKISAPVNRLMLNQVEKFKILKDYAYEQALLKAPELLI